MNRENLQCILCAVNDVVGADLGTLTFNETEVKPGAYILPDKVHGMQFPPPGVIPQGINLSVAQLSSIPSKQMTGVRSWAIVGIGLATYTQDNNLSSVVERVKKAFPEIYGQRYYEKREMEKPEKYILLARYEDE